MQRYWDEHNLNSKELYELIDQEVHREHNLISNRMTWYVTSQSFLMAAFAVSGSQGNSFSWLSKPFLPILGILTSIIIWVSLIAALVSMHQLRDYKRKILETDSHLQNIEPFKSRFSKDSWIHYFGISPPATIPPIFLIVWIIILVRVYK